MCLLLQRCLNLLRGSGFTRRCVFLEIFVRVNDRVFLFLNGPPPPPCQNATGNNLANIWATVPHQPAWGKSHGSRWATGQTRKPVCLTLGLILPSTHMIKNTSSWGMCVPQTINMHTNGWVVDGVNGSGVCAHSLGQALQSLSADNRLQRRFPPDLPNIFPPKIGWFDVNNNKGNTL